MLMCKFVVNIIGTHAHGQGSEYGLSKKLRTRLGRAPRCERRLPRSRSETIVCGRPGDDVIYQLSHSLPTQYGTKFTQLAHTKLGSQTSAPLTDSNLKPQAHDTLLSSVSLMPMPSWPWGTNHRTCDSDA
eukprot:8731785-Pyramimonas_sp.AAC.2